MIVFSSLQIRRGVRLLLDNATATINPGQKVGLVGKNGCGKSTLLALLKNEISADGGSFSDMAKQELKIICGAVNEILSMTVDAYSRDDKQLVRKIEPF